MLWHTRPFNDPNNSGYIYYDYGLIDGILHMINNPDLTESLETGDNSFAITQMTRLMIDW